MQRFCSHLAALRHQVSAAAAQMHSPGYWSSGVILMPPNSAKTRWRCADCLHTSSSIHIRQQALSNRYALHLLCLSSAHKVLHKQKLATCFAPLQALMLMVHRPGDTRAPDEIAKAFQSQFVSVIHNCNNRLATGRKHLHREHLRSKPNQFARECLLKTQ